MVTLTLLRWQPCLCHGDINVVEVTAVFVVTGYAAPSPGCWGTTGQQQHGAVLPCSSATGALTTCPDNKHTAHQQLQQVIMLLPHAWQPCCAVRTMRSPSRPVAQCHWFVSALLVAPRHLQYSYLFSFFFILTSMFDIFLVLVWIPCHFTEREEYQNCLFSYW